MRFLGRLRWLLLLSLCTTAAAVAAPSASADCTIPFQEYGVGCVEVDGPWVVTPAYTNGWYPPFYSMSWTLSCPDSAGYAVSSWYVLAPDAMLVPFVIPGWQVSTTWLMQNYMTSTQTWMPTMACVPVGRFAVPLSASYVHSVARGRPTRHRVSTFAVHPSRRDVHSRSCPPNERLVRADHGIGFFTKNPPTKAEIAEIHVDRTVKRGRLTVAVHVGAHVGDDEKVLVQLHLECAPN